MKKYQYIFLIIISVLFLTAILSIFIYYQYVHIRLDVNNFPLEQKWSSRVGAAILEISGVDNGNLIFVRTARALYAFDSETGREVWNFKLSYQAVPSPALASNGIVYVADSKSLWALDQINGIVIWEQSLSDVDGQVISASNKAILVSNTYSNVSAYDAKTGTLLWMFPVYWYHTKFYVNKNIIYIPEDGIYAIDLDTGQVVLEKGLDAVTDSDFYDGIIYYVTPGSVVAFDTQDNTEIWRRDIELSRYGLPILKIQNKYLLVLDMYSVITLNRDTGKPVWKTSVSAPVNPSVVGDTVFVMEGFNRTIRALQIDTGKNTGFLRASGYHLLLVDSRQNMISLDNMLIFSRGNELIGLSPKSN